MTELGPLMRRFYGLHVARFDAARGHIVHDPLHVLAHTLTRL